MIEELLKLKKNCRLTDIDVIGDLLQPMDEGKDFVSGDNNYIWFYLIGKYFRPKVIVEMGTRFGYSMKAFVTGAEHFRKDYVINSYDLECDGIKTLDIFENYFSKNLGIKNIDIYKVDTKYLSWLNIEEADLVLVDAYHTEDGCYHECELAFKALKNGGVLVVDDTNYEDIRKGVERFCNNNGLKYHSIPSLRGIYIIQK